MIFNPRTILSEAATADLLDADVSEEVKDVIEELEDDLVDGNIEEVKDDDKTTNGGIPVTTESVSILESASRYGKARYLVRLEDVIAIKEAEGEEAAEEKLDEPGEAPTEEEIEAEEPDAGNVIEDIAEKNGVDPDQVAVVINAEQVSFLAETALLESKAGRKKKKAKATKKLKKIKKTIDELNEAHVKIVKA